MARSLSDWRNREPRDQLAWGLNCHWGPATLRQRASDLEMSRLASFRTLQLRAVVATARTVLDRVKVWRGSGVRRAARPMRSDTDSFSACIVPLGIPRPEKEDARLC